MKEGERCRFEMLNRGLVVQGQLLHGKKTNKKKPACVCNARLLSHKKLVRAC